MRVIDGKAGGGAEEQQRRAELCLADASVVGSAWTIVGGDVRSAFSNKQRGMLQLEVFLWLAKRLFSADRVRIVEP